jgi:hypothetical protein
LVSGPDVDVRPWQFLIDASGVAFGMRKRKVPDYGDLHYW